MSGYERQWGTRLPHCLRPAYAFAVAAGLLLVNHLAGHAAIDHEIGSGDETRPVAIEEKGGHFRDVLGPADASADGQSVGERDKTALAGR